MKIFFISSKKHFLLLKYLRFSPDFFSHVEKRFVKKANVDFKTSDIINWDTNNYNTQITQHLKK